MLWGRMGAILTYDYAQTRAVDDAVEAYASGIGAAISDELARLLGDDSI